LGTGHDFDEQAQLRRDLGLAALLLDQILRQADVFGHGFVSIREVHQES
jgi:hypothetical protein